MKIIVIGYAGSGKSTLSKSIAENYDLALLYLDVVHFLPNWEKRSLNEEQAIVKDFLDKNKDWIIDGNYFEVFFNERLEQADKIILFNFGRLACLFRACKRSFKYRNKTRESMNPECDEVIDMAFIKHILFDRKDETKVYKEVVNKYKDKIVIVNNQKELDNLHKQIKQHTL